MDEKGSKDTPKRTTTSQSKLPDSPFAGGILQSPSTIRSTPRSPVKGQSLVALHAQAQAKDKAKDKEGRDAATTATWTSQRQFVASPQKQTSAALASASPARKFTTPSGNLNTTTPRRKTLVERAGEFPPKSLQPPPQSPSTSGDQRLVSEMALVLSDEHRLGWNQAVDALRQKHRDEMKCMQERHQEELAALCRQYGADEMPRGK